MKIINEHLFPDTPVIISGFAGIGKSEYAKMHSNSAIDLESSVYHWEWENTDAVSKYNIEQRKGLTSIKRYASMDWPMNYIDAIQQNYNDANYDVILIASDLLTRLLLDEASTPYILAYPNKASKQTYINRCIKRGNQKAFIRLLENRFELWVDALDKVDNKCKIILEDDEYLDDALQALLNK